MSPSLSFTVMSVTDRVDTDSCDGAYADRLCKLTIVKEPNGGLGLMTIVMRVLEVVRYAVVSVCGGKGYRGVLSSMLNVRYMPISQRPRFYVPVPLIPTPYRTCVLTFLSPDNLLRSVHMGAGG